jgi:hypothetical protein
MDMIQLVISTGSTYANVSPNQKFDRSVMLLSDILMRFNDTRLFLSSIRSGRFYIHYQTSNDLDERIGIFVKYDDIDFVERFSFMLMELRPLLNNPFGLVFEERSPKRRVMAGADTVVQYSRLQEILWSNPRSSSKGLNLMRSGGRAFVAWEPTASTEFPTWGLPTTVDLDRLSEAVNSLSGS